MNVILISDEFDFDAALETGVLLEIVWDRQTPPRVREQALARIRAIAESDAVVAVGEPLCEEVTK